MATVYTKDYPHDQGITVSNSIHEPDSLTVAMPDDCGGITAIDMPIDDAIEMAKAILIARYGEGGVHIVTEDEINRHVDAQD